MWEKGGMRSPLASCLFYAPAASTLKLGVNAKCNVTKMVNRSSSPPTSLKLLLHEIEATPREYWTDLLDILRQFRQKIPSTVPSVVDAEQAQKNQAAIALLDSWLEDSEDALEHQQAWEFLKTALDEDRLSDRPLFP
jgi:hypothetical protein